jgi:hypothetical protein
MYCTLHSHVQELKLHRQCDGTLLVYNYHGILTWLLIRLRIERKGVVKSVAIKTVLKRVRGSAAALLLLQPSLLALVIHTSPCQVLCGHPSFPRLDAVSPRTPPWTWIISRTDARIKVVPLSLEGCFPPATLQV